MKRKIEKTIIVTLTAGIICYLYVRFHISLECVFFKLTGLYCPGCGITRMLLAISQFDFIQAYRYNPLVFSLLPFSIPLFLNYYYNWLKDNTKNSWARMIPNWVWYTLLGVVILFGIMRNFSIFSFLVPTHI